MFMFIWLEGRARQPSIPPPGIDAITSTVICSQNSCVSRDFHSSSCLERTPSIHTSSKTWKWFSHLPVVSMGSGEILFKWYILNSVWILVQAVEGKRPPCCSRQGSSCMLGAMQQRYCWHFIILLGLYHPILCNMNLKR